MVAAQESCAADLNNNNLPAANSLTPNSYRYKTNLVDLSATQLRELLLSLGEKPFRVQQLWGWIYQRGVEDFAAMTNLSKSLRAYLADHYTITWPQVKTYLDAPDGTRKWVIELADGACIESVYIPDGQRGTVCLSSQVGCAVGCAFCATGRMGAGRNLTLSEIIGQFKIALQTFSQDQRNLDHAITNVVFMGMGEPMLNLTNVSAALEILLDDYAYGLSKYRVTVSSSGLVPQLMQLRDSGLEVALAISLHATNDHLRNQLVPTNRAYPIAALLALCDHFYADPRRAVTIEYIMLDGVNDSDGTAQELVKLLAQGHYKVNLIPFNPVPGVVFRPSPSAQIDRFRDILMQAGITTITRRARGEQIAAACGQLAQRNAKSQIA